MSAMERFEYTERDSENKNAEKNIEKNTETNEIKTKEELEDMIQNLINSYKTVKELESMGIDGGAAEIVQNRMKELIEQGIQKSLITEEEKNAYYEEINKIEDEERNDQNERDEQEEKREEKEIEEEEKSKQNKEQNIEENQIEEIEKEQEENIEEKKKEDIEKEQEKNIEEDKPFEENSKNDEIKEPENLRDKKMTINEWCEVAAFQKYNEENKEVLLENIKKCGKDIYGKDVTIDNIDLNKEISMDEFYEIQVNGAMNGELFGKSLAPKTQEFINEYYPALAKQSLSLYLDNNMSYATSEDKKIAEAHKEAFDGNFNILKEIAGKDAKSVSEIEKLYNSMGRNISNSDKHTKNEITDLLFSIKENADKEVKQYGISENLRDKKMTINEWCKEAAFQKYNEENKEVLLENIKKCGKDIYGKDVTIDNIDLNKEISMDEFYEIQVNGAMNGELFGKSLAPKTQEFLNEYYPALVKRDLTFYLDNNMSYATSEDEKIAEYHKEGFDIHLNILKEIAGKDTRSIGEISKIYNSMGRNISNLDKYSKNEISDLLSSIRENAEKDLQEYGVKDKEQNKTEQQDDRKKFVRTKHPEENIKVGTGTVVQSDKENQSPIMQTEEGKRIQTGDIQKAMENENIRAGAPVGQKVGNRLDGQSYQPPRYTYNEQQNIEEQTTDEKSLAVIPERKGFINWVKEKFNSIKEFFSKNKSNDIELDETGQAWQDYIDAQEGNENKTETSKRESFVNSITMNNKLKNQEQQKKAFEAVKKWEQQNKNAIEQENDDREP